MPKISALPPAGTLADDDETPFVDDSVASTKKFTLAGLLVWLQSKTSWIITAMINNDAVTGPKSAVFPLATDRQSIAVNSVLTDPHMESGWTYVTGDASNLREEIAITFPTAFDTIPIMFPSMLGVKAGSNPTTPGDSTSIPATFGDLGWQVSFYGTTVNGTTMVINKSTGAIGTANRLLLGWLAVGTKAR